VPNDIEKGGRHREAAQSPEQNTSVFHLTVSRKLADTLTSAAEAPAVPRCQDGGGPEETRPGPHGHPRPSGALHGTASADHSLTARAPRFHLVLSLLCRPPPSWAGRCHAMRLTTKHRSGRLAAGSPRPGAFGLAGSALPPGSGWSPGGGSGRRPGAHRSRSILIRPSLGRVDDPASGRALLAAVREREAGACARWSGRWSWPGCSAASTSDP
jgi:hypothetical protein